MKDDKRKLSRDELFLTLEITDQTETVIPSGDGTTIAMVHQTGHIYAQGKDGNTVLLARVKYQNHGAGAPTETPERAGQPDRKCDSPGCPDPALGATSVAPGVYLATCADCRKAMDHHK